MEAARRSLEKSRLMGSAMSAANGVWILEKERLDGRYDQFHAYDSRGVTVGLGSESRPGKVDASGQPCCQGKEDGRTTPERTEGARCQIKQ